MREGPPNWGRTRRELDEHALADLAAELNPHEEQMKGIKGWFYASYVRFARRHYDPAKADRTLEVGCGDGLLFREEPIKPVQLDISRLRLERAKAHNSRVVQADAYRLPFREGSFDKVYLIAVLEHTRDPGRVVQEIGRVLAPGGEAIVCVPNDLWMTIGRFLLRQRPYRVLDHLTFFTPGKLRRLFRDGFSRVRTQSLPFPLLGFWLSMYYTGVFRKIG